MSKPTIKAARARGGIWLCLACVTALFCLTACVGISPLHQTLDERSYLDIHRSTDIRTWRVPDEAEMAFAQKEARSRFSQFKNAFLAWQPEPTGATEKGKEKTKREDYFEVRVPITVLFATEHIWMRVSDISKDNVIGKLDQSPVYLRMYTQGDSFTVPIDKVEDWAFGTIGDVTGSFTFFPLRKCKLQELNQITVHDGEPTSDSINACNQDWDKILAKFGSMMASEMEKYAEENKTEEQNVWWTKTIDLVKNTKSNLQHNSSSSPSDQELATACGLPIRTIVIINKLEKHLEEFIEETAEGKTANNKRNHTGASLRKSK